MLIIPALHLTDLIAVIVESPEFMQVSKLTIEEIIEKVSSYLSLFPILTCLYHVSQHKPKKASASQPATLP
jgi:hypothetical protein